MSEFAGDVVSERMSGDEPSRLRALGAAIIIGVTAAVVAYNLLRSGQEGKVHRSSVNAIVPAVRTSGKLISYWLPR